ncbi:MAG TPA: hypothetical protein VK665_08030, partial [Candidatus Elarobacter sp.]|nr:hypothetical protein [Candidatus Elarobacter sp.]
ASTPKTCRANGSAADLRVILRCPNVILSLSKDEPNEKARSQERALLYHGRIVLEPEAACGISLSTW